jgi:hypothetical protein
MPNLGTILVGSFLSHLISCEGHFYFNVEALTYKRWSLTESMVISPTLSALMSCLSSSLAAPEVPFCLGSSVLLALLPSETKSNQQQYENVQIRGP